MSWTGFGPPHNPQSYPPGLEAFRAFVHSLDPNHQNFGPSPGVDARWGPPNGSPFEQHRGGPPWRGGGGFWGGGMGGPGFGPWGRRRSCRGRHGRCGHPGASDGEEATAREDCAAPGADSDAEMNEKDKDVKEKEDTPGTMRETPDGPPEDEPHGRHHHHHHHHGPGRRGRGRGRGGWPWGPGRHGHPHGPPPPPPHDGPHPPPPPYFPGANGMPFDFQAMMRSLADHPIAQQFRGFAQQFQPGDNAADATAREGGDFADNNEALGQDEAFTPPLDVFSTDGAFILHVALPGAKKEDIGVNWDPDRRELNIVGVVHRPGDEAFLQSLTSGERRVGLFERVVKLPPHGTEDKDEVDGFGISAKMEDGILIIVVPKMEKEWTEIRKVDIE